jgi:ubiquinone/menaquinone biosynthesis C-methylase UbiE
MQHDVAHELYRDCSEGRWEFHDTPDPLTRYLRDRRLKTALDLLRKHGSLDPSQQSVLVVCGGVGGEGTYLANQGFSDVTVSDLSEEALRICRKRDQRLKTRCLNTESMTDVSDNSYDFVLVQDGLHHLPRPVSGFTEMLRVARRGVIVIEPHYSLVGKLIGTEWEVEGDAINYVFRWDTPTLEQVARSYLLSKEALIIPYRMWDHNLAVRNFVSHVHPARWRLAAAKGLYGALSPVNCLGNMMVAVVLKPSTLSPERLLSH